MSGMCTGEDKQEGLFSAPVHNLYELNNTLHVAHCVDHLSSSHSSKWEELEGCSQVASIM